MTNIHKPELTLNFQGVTCPYNYVKTKLALEEMDLGQIVEVLVDAGEPERHVPHSLKNDGQEILSQTTDPQGIVHIVIKKTKDYD